MQYMHMSPTGVDESTQVDQLSRFLAPLRRVLVLTGAGISTASGIPDYRGPDGIRRGKAPVQGPEFRKFEAVRKRYWARSMVGYPALARAAPNAAHRAIAELQADARLGGLITQNVDGLHQRAGSGDVIELHGNIHGVVCLDCHASFPRRFVQELLEELNPGVHGAAAATTIAAAPDGDAHLEPDALAEFHVADCIHCGGTLKPGVVFFGDGVAPACSAQALAAMEAADALLVVGSSLMVFSGFRFCRMAAASGKPIAAINRGITRADDLLNLKIDGSAERLLPGLRAALAL
jgi:NAD-dependent SIR2 family protein deacetylase